MEFSDLEIKLLREIQADASLSLADLSSRIGMAQSTIWRKLQEFDVGCRLYRPCATFARNS
jgi:Lrp/AsnC family transcriptional regulator